MIFRSSHVAKMLETTGQNGFGRRINDRHVSERGGERQEDLKIKGGKEEGYSNTEREKVLSGNSNVFEKRGQINNSKDEQLKSFQMNLQDTDEENHYPSPVVIHHQEATTEVFNEYSIVNLEGHGNSTEEQTTVSNNSKDKQLKSFQMNSQGTDVENPYISPVAVHRQEATTEVFNEYSIVNLEGHGNSIEEQTTVSTVASTNTISSIKPTTQGGETELQYITVYHDYDDEENALKEIHRNLENIINQTNSDLIGILKSYGFRGDPFVFEIPTDSVLSKDKELPFDDVPSSIHNSRNGFQIPLNAPNNELDELEILEIGQVQPPPLIETPILDHRLNEGFTSESTLISLGITDSDNFEIFSYNQTQNYVEPYTEGPISDVGVDNYKEQHLGNISLKEYTNIKNRFHLVGKEDLNDTLENNQVRFLHISISCRH